MPKSPLDAIVDGIEKIQKINAGAEKIRQSLDSIDPVQKVSDTVGSLQQKVNQLDSLLVKTKRRTRPNSSPPSPPQEDQ